MAIGGAYDFPNDAGAQDEASAAMDVSPGIVYRNDFNPMKGLRDFGHAALDAWTHTPGPFDNTDDPLTADQANAQYAVPGYKRFSEPVSDDDAAFQSHAAWQRMYSDAIASRAPGANPLYRIGASLAGGLIDPVNVALAVGTGGLGEAAMARTGLRSAIDGMVSSKLGRLAIGGMTEGAISNAPFVAMNAGQAAYEGDSYQPGDALRDLAVGAVLHTALHAGGNWSDLFGRSRADSPAADLVPPEGVPDVVSEMSPTERLGAFTKAVDDMAGDRPVDVAQYIDQAPRDADAPEIGSQPEGVPGDDLAASPAPGETLSPDRTQDTAPDPAPDLAPAQDAASTGEEAALAPAEESYAQQVNRQSFEAYANGDYPDADTLRPPGESRPGSAPQEPPQVTLQDMAPKPAPETEAPGAEAPGARAEAPEGEAAAARPAKQPRAITGEQFIAADPELKALAADTAKLMQRHGIEDDGAAAEKTRPNVIAEAIRAAATCLLGEAA